MNAAQISEMDVFELALRQCIDNADALSRGWPEGSAEAARQIGKAVAYRDVLDAWGRTRKNLIAGGGQ